MYSRLSLYTVFGSPILDFSGKIWTKSLIFEREGNKRKIEIVYSHSKRCNPWLEVYCTSSRYFQHFSNIIWRSATHNILLFQSWFIRPLYWIGCVCIITCTRQKHVSAYQVQNKCTVNSTQEIPPTSSTGLFIAAANIYVYAGNWSFHFWFLSSCKTADAFWCSSMF